MNADYKACKIREKHEDKAGPGNSGTVNLEDMLCGVSGVARLLHVSRSKVYRMLRAGDLINPHATIGRSPRWLRAELQDWVLAGCPRREVWRWGATAKAKGGA